MSKMDFRQTGEIRESVDSDDELTGTGRLRRNVLSGWAAHIVVVLTGLIVPRFISDAAGAATLGIWDLGWSTVKYLSLVNFGVAAAMGRYLAFYRASGKSTKLSAVFSSILIWQAVVTLLVIIISGGIVALMPNYLPASLLDQLDTIRWVFGLLAASIAVQMLFGPARGILTGMHRWDANNLINAICDASSAIGMIVVLLLGGGLIELACVHLGATLLAEIARAVMARRLLPEISFAVILAKWKHAREMVLFGMKSSLTVAPSLLIIQSTNIFLAGASGAVALAIFARPVALMTQIIALVNKFAIVLMPMASGMAGLGNTSELGELMIRSSRTAMLLCGPMFAVLAVDGDLILKYWMGAEYASTNAHTILAAGALLPCSMSVALTILAGINSHGRASLYALSIAILSYGLIWTIFLGGAPRSPESAAILMSVSLTAGPGFCVMIFACNKLNVPFKQFFRQALLWPLVSVISIATILWLPRVLLPNSEFLGTTIGLLLAFAFVIATSWASFVVLFTDRARINNQTEIPRE